MSQALRDVLTLLSHFTYVVGCPELTQEQKRAIAVDIRAAIPPEMMVPTVKATREVLLAIVNQHLEVKPADDGGSAPDPKPVRKPPAKAAKASA